jgi:glycogen operon protein
MGGFEDEADVHVILNMDPNDQSFELPIVSGRRWRRVVDTSRESPEDIVERGDEEPIDGTTFRATGRSVVVLIAR